MPKVDKSGLGGKAYSYQAHLLWKGRLVSVCEVETMSF